MAAAIRVVALPEHFILQEMDGRPKMTHCMPKSIERVERFSCLSPVSKHDAAIDLNVTCTIDLLV